MVAWLVTLKYYAVLYRLRGQWTLAAGSMETGSGNIEKWKYETTFLLRLVAASNFFLFFGLSRLHYSPELRDVQRLPDLQWQWIASTPEVASNNHRLINMHNLNRKKHCGECATQPPGRLKRPRHMIRSHPTPPHDNEAEAPFMN